MDQQGGVVTIVVVKTWLLLCKDEVWFEADNIFEEAAEFIEFTSYDHIWSRVFLKVSLVLRNRNLELLGSLAELLELASELKHLEIIITVSKCLHLANMRFNSFDKRVHGGQGVL